MRIIGSKRRGIETQSPAECSGILGQGVHDETANANRIGRVSQLAARRPKHRPTNSWPVVRLSPPQGGSGPRRGSGRAFSRPGTTRRSCDGDSTRCERIVSDHRTGLAADERTRSTGRLICASTTLEPFVERRLPTSKVIEPMLRAERLRRRELHPTFQGSGCFIVRRSLALGLAGASRRSRNSAYALGPTEIRA